MRKFLLSAVAGAPLLLLAAGPALADTTVASTTSEVKTSTANNGQPDNVIIGSGATVNVAGPVAVTMDSSNNITNQGSIATKDQDNSTAVLLNGGHTGQFGNNSSISNTETYTRTDTNGDGVLDGVYAKGTNRYGVHLVGPGTLTGTITNATSAAISVQGNNSFGLALDAPLQGDLAQQGTLSVTGDNSTALSVTGGISGKALLTGPTTALGQNSVGASFQGDVGGALSIYSTVSSTGYSLTTRSPDPAVNSKLLPSNLLISGSALQIGADVKGGVFIGAPPAGTSLTDATTDADHDGIIDSAEATGSVTTFGTAPAIGIGSSSRDVHISPYGTGSNAYGLIIEGTVTGNGVFDGHSGTAVQIGGSGGHLVTIDGIHVANSSTISGIGYQDNATGIHLLSGASASKLLNEGAISAGSTTSAASQATALQIEAGASLTSLSNTGVIGASVTGDLGSAAAIVDKSGTLSSVTNTNIIGATVTPTLATETATGSTVAIDLRANTSGVTLTQNAFVPPTTTTTTVTPKINGDVLLGSGFDTVALNAGTMTGALDFGQGSGSFTIDNGSGYTGQLLATGSTGSLAINVKNGSLVDLSPTTLSLSSLNVGATGQLTVSVDPTAATATRFNVTGPATFADGAKLSLKLLNLVDGPQSYTIVSSAGGLTVGGAHPA